MDTKPETDATRADRSRQRGLKSLYGKMWSIATQTGWPIEYIRDKVPWSTVQKMVSDAAWYEDIPIDPKTGKPIAKTRERKMTLGEHMTKMVNAQKK